MEFSIAILYFVQIFSVVIAKSGYVREKVSSIEAQFLDIPNPAYAYEHLSFYTSMPHIAGSPEDYQTALYTYNKFQEFGLANTVLLPYDVLLSYPNSRLVELLEPTYFNLSLQEDYIPKDPTSGDPRIVPTFNGYSPSGDVTAELVYLNYASIDDFSTLQSLGVDVSGKIGIARYGGLFRGTKAMIAQEKGMIGLLLYSDPADDGYVQGTVFPDGPWRPESGVQRGSVSFLSICPGDPSRPVCSNDPNYNYTQGIPSIPVQPISWGDALPLLKSLKGVQAPKNFQGGLNFTYMIGPGPASVHIKLDNTFTVAPIWDVCTFIYGENLEEIVLLGNHRDAWVFGAADPNSGTATLLEVARGYAELTKSGWVPERTLALCSWDGEEYGLLGSTAFAESDSFLYDTAVAYLNVDVSVTGTFFGAGASPSLISLLRNATEAIVDPATGKLLSQVWDGEVDVLGSGSDFTAFLDRFGIPSLDMGFGGPYGVYHSTYDDIYWMNNFGDPTYDYFVAMAQLWGLMGLRLADSTIIPFNFTDYANALQSYSSQLATLVTQYNSTLNLDDLNAAIQSFTAAAASINDRGFTIDEINDIYLTLERNFLIPTGLPKRPYYLHSIQAPGIYEGYGAETFPGVTQSIKLGDPETAQEQYQFLVDTIQEATLSLMNGI